jgi:ferredoxin-thioredoxin reductase catalytic subunit
MKDALLVEYQLIKTNTPLALWIVVIGGIASLGTQERYWYAELLREISATCGCRTWIDILEQVQKLLWLPCFHDVEAHNFWEEWCLLYARRAKADQLLVL